MSAHVSTSARAEARRALADALADLKTPTPCQGPDRDNWTADDPELLAEAAKACQPCPVREACRAAGRGERWGVWGGRARRAGIETARTTTDGFVMNPAGPVDATARKLFGVPVVVVPTMAANLAYIITEGALAIKHDGQGIRVDWGVIDDSFARNQVLGRAEGRFDLAALRPAGVVEVALA